MLRRRSLREFQTLAHAEAASRHAVCALNGGDARAVAARDGRKGVSRADDVRFGRCGLLERFAVARMTSRLTDADRVPAKAVRGAKLRQAYAVAVRDFGKRVP